METEMRRDLFEHYQTLSFRFYEQQKTGQLMTRITNDLESISKLYHHEPEDIAIGLVKFVGTFTILSTITIGLTCNVRIFRVCKIKCVSG